MKKFKKLEDRNYKCVDVRDHRDLELSVTFRAAQGGGIGGQVDFDFKPTRAERKRGLMLAGKLFSKCVRLCAANKKIGLGWASHIRIRREDFPNHYRKDREDRWNDHNGSGRKVMWAECYPSLTLYVGLNKLDNKYWRES